MTSVPLIASAGTSSTQVWRLVAFTGTAFGGAALLSKRLVDDGIDPFMVTWLPFLCAGLLGLVISGRRQELSTPALLPGAILGVTSSAGPAILFNTGFETLPAGIVTLLISMAPVFTAVIAHFAFPDERFNPVKAAGLGLAVSGVAVLALNPSATEGEGSARAMLTVLVGSMIAGAAAVLQRRYALSHGSRSLVAPQLTSAGLVALALTPILGRSFSPDGGFASWHIPAMIALGLIVSYFGFAAMLLASELGTTGQVSVISYMIPLFGVVGGVVIFGDDMHPTLMIGATLIVIAVAVIGRGSRIPSPTVPAAGPTPVDR